MLLFDCALPRGLEKNATFGRHVINAESLRARSSGLAQFLNPQIRPTLVPPLLGFLYALVMQTVVMIEASDATGVEEDTGAPIVVVWTTIVAGSFAVPVPYARADIPVKMTIGAAPIRRYGGNRGRAYQSVKRSN